jgi:hypothetical protein
MLKPALPDDLIRRARRAKPRRRRAAAPPRPGPAPIPHVEAKALERHGGFLHTRMCNRGK